MRTLFVALLPEVTVGQQDVAICNLWTRRADHPELQPPEVTDTMKACIPSDSLLEFGQQVLDC
jgi:hypothetical protein